MEEVRIYFERSAVSKCYSRHRALVNRADYLATGIALSTSSR